MISQPKSLPIVTTIIKRPADWIRARQRAQVISAALGFSSQDQVRVATAVSEIACNALEYAGGGKVEFIAEREKAAARLFVRISDHGPGIRDLEAILAGVYRSPHGLGIGITGSRALMDDFNVESRLEHGTTVELRKYLPRNAAAITPDVLRKIDDAISRPSDPLEEAQQYNQDLLRTLDELNRVNRELSTANASKDAFLETVSHELRTPMTAIIGWLQFLEQPDLDETTRAQGAEGHEWRGSSPGEAHRGCARCRSSEIGETCGRNGAHRSSTVDRITRLHLPASPRSERTGARDLHRS